MSMVAVVVALLSLSFLVKGGAVDQNPPGPCKITITSPRAGTSVTSEADVLGTASIPPGTHLWVFVHRRGLALWWPQGGGPASLTEGQWRVLATFGQTKDAGSDFEITVAIVDTAKNNELLNWVERAEKSGTYPGMRLPTSIEGCLVTPMVVTRRSDIGPR